MSTPRFTAEELDRLRALAAQWGQVVSRRAFGDDGPGLDVDFRTSEQVATAAVGMSGVAISESQVRRLAHEVGRELIERDREARRAPPPRTEVTPEESAACAWRRPRRRRSAWSPERRVRTCVASLRKSSAFGPLVAAEAQRRLPPGEAAGVRGRRAGVQLVDPPGYFRDFEPIVDFLRRAVSRVLRGAGGESGRGEWLAGVPGVGAGVLAGAGGLCAGRVGRLARALGPPPPGEARRRKGGATRGVWWPRRGVI
ncbi:MAG: hypothetical protein U0797_04280 [Gemmataceae bacterium]